VAIAIGLVESKGKKKVTEGRAPGPKSWGHTPLWGVPHSLREWVFSTILETPHPPRKEDEMYSSHPSQRLVQVLRTAPAPEFGT